MKMSKRAERALRICIEEWETKKLLEGERAEEENCELCKLYNRDGGCGVCPINRKTGRSCIGAYVRFYNNACDVVAREYFAKKMIVFMKRLLPRKKRAKK